MDFFGTIKKITHTKTLNKDEEEEDQWRVNIEDKSKNRISLIFGYDPAEEFPLGAPIQVKITCIQTTLTAAVPT